MDTHCDTNVDTATTGANKYAHLAWQSAHGWSRPKRLECGTDGMRADQATRLVSQGVGVVWAGDFFEGRSLLQAIKRRLDTKTRSQTLTLEALPWPDRFHRIRLQRAQTARQLGLLLIKVSQDFTLNYRRAPDAKEALEMAYGERLANSEFLVPLTELTGVLSAYEWHRKGLPLATLEASIYPRWGVFAPTRHEYLDLVMQAELPKSCHSAVDVGTGTGVLALLLAKRGIQRIVATDTNQSAILCATDNVARAGMQDNISVVDTDLLPEGRFDLLVCNPPWLPGTASGPLEAAVYDPKHQMLRGFLAQAAQHLNPHGQAWLILSDLAEHLQLRSRQTLLDWISEAGLGVYQRLDVQPRHHKAADATDPLAQARGAEVTSLWQLCSLDEMP